MVCCWVCVCVLFDVVCVDAWCVCLFMFDVSFVPVLKYFCLVHDLVLCFSWLALFGCCVRWIVRVCVIACLCVLGLVVFFMFMF